MKPALHRELPKEREKILHRVKVYEWLTILWFLFTVLILSLVMGGSQSVKTEWIQTVLSLVPPIAWLVASRVRLRAPTSMFPYGYHKSVTLAFLCGSITLFLLGAVLLYEGGHKLLSGDHPTVGSQLIFGHLVWQGWLMIGALLISMIGPFILGRIKLKLASQLHDKALYSDARMNAADWLSASAAIVGVAGIGIGWWWLDGLAACFISIDILLDGYKNVRTSVADLMDRAPHTVNHEELERLPQQLVTLLEELPWVAEAQVRLREDGHVFFGEAFVRVSETDQLVEKLLSAAEMARRMDWRLQELVVMPVLEFTGEEPGP